MTGAPTLLKRQASLLISQGQKEAARAAFEASLRLYKPLVQDKPWTNRIDYARASCAYATFLNDEIGLRVEQQRPPGLEDAAAAATAYAEALNIYDKCGAEFDTEKALARDNWGALLEKTGDLKNAYLQYDAALGTAKRCWVKSPKDPLVVAKLAGYCQDLIQVGLKLLNEGQRDSRKLAGEALTAVKAIRRALASQALVDFMDIDRQIAELEHRLNEKSR